MNPALKIALYPCIVWICLAGCGGNPPSPTPPASSACSGQVISGTMLDSLTSLPVAQGTAVIESGSELGTTPAYYFAPAQMVSTDTQGAFSFCVQTLASPSAIVLEAMDSTGKAYPPYVASIAGAANLGAIPMGGCTGTCWLLTGQQQTSTPATITGQIASTPAALTGSVTPQYALQALDGSKDASGYPNVWALAMPVFSISRNLTFSTTPGACAGSSSPCSTYTFTVPSQSPIRSVTGGYTQAAVPPIYMIYAVANSTPVCTPSSAITIYQPDGKSFLTATPGAQLTAASLAFGNCH